MRISARGWRRSIWPAMTGWWCLPRRAALGWFSGGGVDLGGGRGLTALDRALRGAASLVYGLEERLRAPTQCPRAYARRVGGDAVWTHVREAGHRDHRRQFAAKGRVERAHGTHLIEDQRRSQISPDKGIRLLLSGCGWTSFVWTRGPWTSATLRICRS